MREDVYASHDSRWIKCPKGKWITHAQNIRGVAGLFCRQALPTLNLIFVQAQVCTKVLRCLRESCVVLAPRQCKSEGPLSTKNIV